MIYIKRGIYKENMVITNKKWNLMMIGDKMDGRHYHHWELEPHGWVDNICKCNLWYGEVIFSFEFLFPFLKKRKTTMEYELAQNDILLWKNG